MSLLDPDPQSTEAPRPIEAERPPAADDMPLADDMEARLREAAEMHRELGEERLADEPEAAPAAAPAPAADSRPAQSSLFPEPGQGKPVEVRSEEQFETLVDSAAEPVVELVPHVAEAPERAPEVAPEPPQAAAPAPEVSTEAPVTPVEQPRVEPAQAAAPTAEVSEPIEAPAETPSGAPAAPAGPLERLPEPLRKAIRARGFDSLTSVQEAVLDAGDRDLQISSQTGSGKTVAIGMVLASKLLAERPDSGRPRGPKVLVLTPTRELAMQVKGELDWLYGGVRSVDVDCVTGGTSVGFERRRLERPTAILVGTPGRVLDHLSSGKLDFSELEAVVLDEADQMLDMGFRDELEGILEKMPAERRMHLVSATFPSGIQRLAKNYQDRPERIEGTALGEANADIEHVVHLVADLDRRAAIINLLLLTGNDRTLVFVKQRAEANHVAEMLSKDGFPALPLSGELVQAQRTRTLESFKSGRVNVLVATDVAARGLDVPEVMTVIHTSPPIDSESYVHRSGRTGRAGKKGRSVLLAPPQRARKVEWLMRDAGVEFRFEPVPSAPQVEKVLVRREAAELAKLLDKTKLQPDLIARAEELLEGRLATDVVAALLTKARPERPAAPQDLARHQPPRPRRPEGPGARQIADRNARADRGRRDEFESRESRPTRKRGVQAPKGSGDFVRFRINWGFEGGANPRRLLAMACRRGGITKHEVGAIGVDPRTSTIDVSAHAANEFQAKASRRDSRDKHLVIERA